MDASTVVDLEIENAYKKLEREINYKLFSETYVNHLASTLLAKFIKFSAICQSSSHQIHLCLEAIIIYIINRLLKLTKNQFHRKFNPRKIEREFLQWRQCSANNNNNNNNNYNFSIQCSEDVKRKYFITDAVEKIDVTLQSHYNVKCVGHDYIEFECYQYDEILGPFNSFNGMIYENIPFSRLREPVVYKCLIAPEKYPDIEHVLLLKLRKEGGYLMIIILTKPKPYDTVWFNFLQMAHIEDIAASHSRVPYIKELILPLMTDIKSNYSNVHNVIEDIDDFKHFLFMDINNKYRDIKNFDIQTVSTLSVQNPITNNDDSKPDWIINKPYLYLLLNKHFLIKAGGIYDAHIFNNQYKTEKEENNQRHDFKVKMLKEKF